MLDSVRARLTLCQVAVLAFLLILFSMAVYALMSSILSGRVDAVLSSVVDDTISMLTKEANQEGLLFFAPSHALKASSFPDTSLAIFGGQPKLLVQENIRGYRAWEGSSRISSGCRGPILVTTFSNAIPSTWTSCWPKPGGLRQCSRRQRK